MSDYDPTPIALTDGNVAMLQGPAAALAAVDLDPTSGEPEMVSACVDYLVTRVEMPEDLAWRVLDALQRLAA